MIVTAVIILVFALVFALIAVGALLLVWRAA